MTEKPSAIAGGFFQRWFVKAQSQAFNVEPIVLGNFGRINCLAYSELS
ncbi:MAG: hypothetical protein AAGG53_08865 [Cyanobacteria bacterium P01_H01_bin.152]